MQSRILKQLLYILKNKPRGLSEFRLSNKSNHPQKTVHKYMILAQRGGLVEHGYPNLWVPTEEWLKNFKIPESLIMTKDGADFTNNSTEGSMDP